MKHVHQVTFEAGRPRRIPAFRCRVLPGNRTPVDDRFMEPLDEAPTSDAAAPTRLRALIEADDGAAVEAALADTFDSCVIISGPEPVDLHVYIVTFAGEQPRWTPSFPVQCIGTMLDQFQPSPIWAARVHAADADDARAWAAQVSEAFQPISVERMPDDADRGKAHVYDVTVSCGDPLRVPSFHCRPIAMGAPVDAGERRTLRAFVPADDEQEAVRLLVASFADLHVVGGPRAVELREYEVVFAAADPRWTPPFLCWREGSDPDLRMSLLGARLLAVDEQDAWERIELVFERACLRRCLPSVDPHPAVDG